MTHDLPPGPPRRPLRALPPLDDEWIPPDDAATPVVASEIPPRDDLRDAERAVLGAMLTSQRARDLVAQTLLASTDFHDWRHEFIAHAINRHPGPVDPITIGHSLAQTSDLPRVGGQAYLHELVQWAAVPETAEYLATTVIKPAAQRRRATSALTSALDKATNGGDDLAGILEAARIAIDAELEDVTDGTTQSRPWSPIDLTSAWDDPTGPIQPTILARRDGFNLLYAGSIHTISGEPESGKSWMALIATAQQLDDGHRVVYIDFEDRPDRIVGRLRALGATRDAVISRFHYLRPDAALNPAGARDLDQAVTGASLVVLDGVTEAMTLHGLSLMDNEDAARFLALLPRRIANLGPAVLQIDHVVKDSESRGRYAIGAQHKLAGLDGAAYGCKVIDPFARGKRGKALITVHKDREGAVREQAQGMSVAELILDSSGDDGKLYAWLDSPTSSVDETGNFRPTILMEKISRFVEAHPGILKGEVEKQVRGKGTALRQALSILITEGWIREEKGPSFKIYLHETTPYRAGDAAEGGAE